MKLSWKTAAKISLPAALSLLVILVQAQDLYAGQTNPGVGLGTSGGQQRRIGNDPVDDNRIHLMGHSLGGGGALHMGEKYSANWAAVAGLAPAAFGFQWSADQNLKNIPLLIILGDRDTLVAGSRQLADQLKGFNFQVEYKSLPGLDHGGIIGGSMPDVFKFFSQHARGGIQ